MACVSLLRLQHIHNIMFLTRSLRPIFSPVHKCCVGVPVYTAASCIIYSAIQGWIHREAAALFIQCPYPSSHSQGSKEGTQKTDLKLIFFFWGGGGG
jgi:hypothetical protein